MKSRLACTLIPAAGAWRPGVLAHRPLAMRAPPLLRVCGLAPGPSGSRLPECFRDLQPGGVDRHGGGLQCPLPIQMKPGRHYRRAKAQTYTHICNLHIGAGMIWQPNTDRGRYPMIRVVLRGVHVHTINITREWYYPQKPAQNPRGRVSPARALSLDLCINCAPSCVA